MNIETLELIHKLLTEHKDNASRCCDIQPCSGGHPEWHLQVDALEMLKMRWDMIIAFPPGTDL